MADPLSPDQMAEKLEQDRIYAQKQADNFAKANYYKYTLSQGLGLAGAVVGIIIAVKRKSGFWGGVGWFLLISTAGSASGYIIGSVLDGRPKQS